MLLVDGEGGFISPSTIEAVTEPVIDVYVSGDVCCHMLRGRN